jgi:superfamily II DNA or RNA helicase
VSENYSGLGAPHPEADDDVVVCSSDSNVTNGPELRQYQLDIIADLRQKISEGQRGLVIPLPTGAGKTIVAASYIDEEVRRGRRVLFLAHRRELIHQSSRKLFDLDVDHGVILPGHLPRLHEPVQVASIASLYARAARSGSMEWPKGRCRGCRRGAPRQSTDVSDHPQAIP